MLLSDFLGAILIPSLIVQNNSESDPFPFDNTEDRIDTKIVNLPHEHDPLIQEVNREMRQLKLEYSDDYFDHLEHGSEESRNLIRNRQQALLQKTTTLPPTTTASLDEMTTEQLSSEITSTAKPTIIERAVNVVKKINPLSYFGRKTTEPPTTTTTESPSEDPELAAKCNSFQIFFKGNCTNLLTPCNNSTEWLIEDPETLKPKCVSNPCHHEARSAWFAEKCVRVGTPSGSKMCAEGMRTYIYKSGIVECDCKEGYIYHAPHGKCYSAYSRGPCQSGYQFRLNPHSIPECIRNPCGVENRVCLLPCENKQVDCQLLNKPCNEGEGTKGKFIIHPEKLEPYCHIEYRPATTRIVPVSAASDIQKIIGNVPTLRCAPGSKRDILGNCRSTTVIDFS